MGHVGCKNLSTLSKCYCQYFGFEVFPNLFKMVCMIFLTSKSTECPDKM